MIEKKYVNSPKEIDGIRVVDEPILILDALKNGETIMHYERGNSMHPILMDGEYCKISPIERHKVKVGDAVFCSIVYPEYGRVFMVHRCTEIYYRDGESFFKIESTDGRFFGWTQNVYGVAKSTCYFEEF